MNSRARTWFVDIFEYFRFVNARRTDARFRFIPALWKTLAGIFFYFLLIYGLFLWADPIVLEWIRRPGREIPQIFQYITLLGTVDWILVPSGIILIGLSLANAKRFTGHQNIVWHRIFLNAYFAFTAIAFSGLLGNLLKNAIGRAGQILRLNLMCGFQYPLNTITSLRVSPRAMPPRVALSQLCLRCCFHAGVGFLSRQDWLSQFRGRYWASIFLLTLRRD